MFKQKTMDESLRAVPGLQGCSDADLARLGRHMEAVTVAAGRQLMIEGAPAREGFLIVGGTAVVTRDGEELATVGVGDIVGEMGLLDNEPRTATVTATTDLDARAFSAPQFAALQGEEAFNRLLTRRLSARLRAADERSVVSPK